MVSLRGMGFARLQKFDIQDNDDELYSIANRIANLGVLWCCVGKRQTYAKKLRPTFISIGFVPVNAGKITSGTLRA